MVLTTEHRKSELIEQITDLVRGKLDKAKAGPVERFVRLYYANVPPDDIVDADPDDLYGAALSLWSFAQNRRRGELKLKVYNPRQAKKDWTSTHTVIEIVNDDMPFLVDSVTAELNRQGHTVHLVVHPIVKLRRGAKGRLLELVPADTGPNGVTSESLMHVEIDEQGDPESLAAVRRGLERILADVRAAVEDWDAMRARVADTLASMGRSVPPQISPDEVAEAMAFLEWANSNHFTFLGYREYETTGTGAASRMEAVKNAGLGILRDPEVHVFEGVRQLNKLPKVVRAFLEKPQLLIINKANKKSTVHRGVHLDAIGVKRLDEKGRITGERLFVGLFTSAAYNRIPRDIPLLRRKVDITIARSGFAPHSHDGKALLHILETLPRDELLQMSEDELFEISMGILHLQERQRVALFPRFDSFQRFVSCLIFVPRERYSTDLRNVFQGILEDAFGGPTTAYDTQIAKDSVLARVQFIIKTTPGQLPQFEPAEIEARLAETSRSWADRLREALVEHYGEEAGLRVLRRYAKAFPTAYREDFAAAAALHDIEHIEETIAGGRLGMHLYRDPKADAAEVRFKIYNLGGPVPLSDVLPMLENMGLKVISEVPYEIEPAGGPALLMHDFEMLRRDGGAVDPEAVRDAFQDAFARVWSGEKEDDGFNRLVIGAGLQWRQVAVVRAVCKYLRQAGIAFSQAYMEETLARNPGLARLVVELFEARFDPAVGSGRAAGTKRLQARIESLLDVVTSLDEDRILRRFVNFVEAMLRTNYYQRGADGELKPYMSFKLDSQRLDELPLPRPFREIFVYSPRVEGVHLRFGMVARGGLRWSDRPEDFRTEILGLVKAQQVKNAVIVPVGSKGGFVVKRPPAGGDREAFLNEGIDCYKTFISGMLDITDNLDGIKVVPPADVVRYDGDDPYLVVAADKGTATFSDIANGVAADYGFWLDDAFASGGSAGYDHKKMGITARGAWESVKRHFREIGTDIQSQDFTVVGCGDMSGDVFGNGMLLSRHIKLVGAFNHLHVFVDPDPDPEKSWAERERLFDLPRSSWSDYDAKLISKGGGVFDRKAKSVKLSPEIKALFGIGRDTLTPSELIRAMLQAPVDLLWFGGIGTYVKSHEETHAEVGDRANDALRIDGKAVKAKVIGEGANLAVTQLGRIEFAMAGGHLNSDAVDNSAGVDCSDHEVNIKILMGAVEAAGGMTRGRRNQLLETMTDEVAELVLRDNYLQTQSLSVTMSLGTRMLDRMVRFMRALEKSGHLDRAVENLPDDETIAQYEASGTMLTRPSLAVLLAYAKITLYDELLRSDLPDDPFMEQDLARYFPKMLQKRYREEIGRHRLRREIIATALTNSIINRAGISFVHEVTEKSGMAASDVARAYTISRQIFDMRGLWASIEAQDNKIPAELQASMLVECGRLHERATVWFLRHGRHPLDIAANVEAYGPGVQLLIKNLDSVLTEHDQAYRDERAACFVELGAPRALAQRIAVLGLLVPTCDIVRIAQGAGTPVDQTARVYFALGDRFGFDWLRRAAARLPIESHWDKDAVAAIVDDLYGHQYDLMVKVLDLAAGAVAAEAVIDAWSESRTVTIERTKQLLEEINAAGSLDLAMLAVANRQLRAMVAG